jgi:glycosyltransferase involved in cell wall biosynthesis
MSNSDKSLEVLFLNHNVIWRSAFHRCFQLARCLVRRGHRLTILTNSVAERLKWKESMIEGVRVVESPDLFYGPLRTGWDPINVLRRNGWATSEVCRLKKVRGNVLVHAFDTRPTVIHPALLLRDQLKCPLVIDWGDWWGEGGAIRLRKPFWLNFAFEPVETFYEETYKLEADWLTCVSEPLKKRSIRLGFSKERMTVIPNPSDPENIQVLDRGACREVLGLDSDRFYTIFSGYVLYDLEMVLHSMEALAERGTGEKIGLILTGAKTNFGKKEFSFPIIQTGTVSRSVLNQYLCAANIALMPLTDHIANWARFPGKVGDYLAAGLPVLLNKVGDIARILEEAKVGLFCNPTPESFADKLSEFMKLGQERETLGRKGRLFAEKEFNWEREVSRLEQLYKKLIFKE